MTVAMADPARQTGALAPGRHGAIDLGEGFGIVGVEQADRRRPDERRRLVAEDLAAGRREIAADEGEIQPKDHVGRVVGQQTVLGGGLGRRRGRRLRRALRRDAEPDLTG